MKEAEFAVETSPNYLEAEKGANENRSVACQVLPTQGQDAVRDLIEVLDIAEVLLSRQTSR